MVFSRLVFTYTLVFKTAQRRQNVDGRVDAFLVQFSRQNNLPLGNVTRKVGNGVRFVVFRHGQDRNLGDTALLAPDTSRALVHRRKVGVEVTGITASAGNFFARRRNF